jgi:putative holliday junction resolvase
VEPDSPGRVLALDLGRRRIGLAVSDPLRLTAQGLPTLERKNRRADLEALRSLVQEYDPQLLLVGQPLHMSGHAGRQAEGAAEFAMHLGRQLHRPVRLWDERLTTAEAQRVLRQSGVSIEKRGAAIDRLAAVILLQSYLDHERLHAAPQPDNEPDTR